MPYIKKEERLKYTKVLDNLRFDVEDELDVLKNSGELNYLITKICYLYILKHGLRYKNINDVMGALEGVKQEFYRRVAAPYENKKIEENGDV